MSLDYVLSAVCDAVKDGIKQDAVYFESSSCHCRAEMSQERELVLVVCGDDVDRFLRLLLLGLLREDDDYDFAREKRATWMSRADGPTEPAGD